MKRVLLYLVAVTTALVTALAIGTAPVSARTVSAPAPLAKIPVTGTTTDGRTFNGTITPKAFTSQGRQLRLNGLLSGTVTGSSNTVNNAAVSVPVALPDATCPILHLTLGPLDLNLLGLTVHLNQVVLDITAISGPGNLLGNLLCAIAGLLNGTGSLTALNQLIAELNALLGLI